MDMATSLLAMLGLVLAIVNFEVDVFEDYFQWDEDQNEYLPAMKTGRFLSRRSYIMRWSIFISSAVAIVTHFARHMFRIAWGTKYVN
jgi:hypothetical protein